MISFRKYLLEEKAKEKPKEDKHRVIAFGRMNPVTTGHEAVVKKMHEVAALHNAEAILIASGTTGDKKNPLTPGEKLKHLKRAFPKTDVRVVGVNTEEPNIIHLAKAAAKEGVTHFHVVTGADRTKEFNDLLHKYNKKGGHYSFKSIKVHGIERPTDAISATKVRSMASSGDYYGFLKSIASNIASNSVHARELFADLRRGMKQGKKNNK